MIYFEKPENFNKKFEIVACFVEVNGKFLILHRQDHKSEGNTWGLPAGKVDDGEDRLLAIKREIKEETGYVAGENNPKLLYTAFVKYKDYDFIYSLYSLSIDDIFDVKIESREHKDFTWITPEEALEKPLIQDLDTCIKLYYNL